jgi:5-methylcytosine-specific restriction endonuclease McrA
VSESKRCFRCGESKPTSEYGPSKQTRDGFFAWCRLCKRLHDKAWRDSHIEIARARQRGYYHANPEPWKAKVTERYQQNRQQYDAYKKAWLVANPKKRQAVAKAWRQANRTQVNVYTAQRRARKADAPTIPFTIAQLEARRDYYGRLCWMCGAAATADDHVKPLAKGGWHCLSNLRPICTPCNTRKRDRWPLI